MKKTAVLHGAFKDDTRFKRLYIIYEICRHLGVNTTVVILRNHPLPTTTIVVLIQSITIYINRKIDPFKNPKLRNRTCWLECWIWISVVCTWILAILDRIDNKDVGTRMMLGWGILSGVSVSMYSLILFNV